MNAINEMSVFGLVPRRKQIDRVLDENLKHRKINPIYVEDDDDHGKQSICQWLTTLTEVVNGIGQSRRTPVRVTKPAELLLRLESLLRSADWRSDLTKVVAELDGRPDLKNISRKGFTDNDIRRLFDFVSASETRRILVALNRQRRCDVLEDALSCFPPES